MRSPNRDCCRTCSGSDRHSRFLPCSHPASRFPLLPPCSRSPCSSCRGPRVDVSAQCDEGFTLSGAHCSLVALLWRRILCSRVQPSSGTAMHPPNAFRIHTILPLLALNGAIIRLEQVRTTCKNCGLRSSLSEDAGFQTDPKGTTLTCPACGATGLMDEMEIWHHWLEQCRRERLLALFDPKPDDPLDTQGPQ